MNTGYSSFALIFTTGHSYLSLLNLGDDGLKPTFDFVRQALENSPNPEKEIRALFAQAGWREHLLGVAVMLAHPLVAENLSDGLWSAFDAGSWVSPQLAVSAWFCDPNFVVHAKGRVATECKVVTVGVDRLSMLERHVVAGPGSNIERSSKGFFALLYLLGLLPTVRPWVLERLQEQNTQELRKADFDNGGMIAEKWLAGLKSKSSILGLKLRDCEG